MHKKTAYLLLALLSANVALAATAQAGFFDDTWKKAKNSVGVYDDIYHWTKKDKTKPSSTKPTILANKRMYQIVDLRSGYNKAKLYAERQGGHLAVIDSVQKSRMLYRFMVNNGYESAYFGLQDEDMDGSWELYNGEKPKFTYWQGGKPRIEEQNEKYAMLYRKYTQGKWKAGSFSPLLENSNTTAFIIEWDKELNPVDYVDPKPAPAPTPEPPPEDLVIDPPIDDVDDWNEISG